MIEFEDLDLFAGLGLRALRLPVLWERTSPDHPDQRDWRWSDARLARMRALNLRPIVGLIHHGGGPHYTSLVDDEGFAKGLAEHARATAERYPWIEDWTPVNEPLTTARFSALYGHWHPHTREEPLFWAALLNQIDAVRLSMRAIRAVNPAARLIQTEDLGRTYATRALAHQASFDNDRRWMTWDLLTGRVTPEHPLWARLERQGLGDRLRVIAEDPCPPDVIGVNHYLTSDRFLDHRLERYPAERAGGNEFMAFADVEAVRVLQPGPLGLEGALTEAWRRYGLPLAVTECHNGCTREEQMRWLVDSHETVTGLRDLGVDVRALTVWALLGACDWNTLLTRADGAMEPGPFDLRGGSPRRTALADVVQALATGGVVPHVAQAPGWWRRDVRLQFQPVLRALEMPEPRRIAPPSVIVQPPILITGATGTLGKALARACEWRGLAYVLTDRATLDLGDEAAAATVLDRLSPWAVINAAGWVRVDDAEAQEADCRAANTAGPAMLAALCASRSLPFVTFSTDLVFDGGAGRPYVETDRPNPLNAYGRSKADAETGVAAAHPGALVIRTSAFFSAYDPHNFAAHVARTLARGETVIAAEDSLVSPTYVPDLVDATLDLLIDREAGLWHLANVGTVSWVSFARAIAVALDLDPRLVVGASAASFQAVAPRPHAVPLLSTRGRLMPSLEDALARHAAMVREAGFHAETSAGDESKAAVQSGLRA